MKSCSTKLASPRVIPLLAVLVLYSYFQVERFGAGGFFRGDHEPPIAFSNYRTAENRLHPVSNQSPIQMVFS